MWYQDSGQVPTNGDIMQPEGGSATANFLDQDNFWQYSKYLTLEHTDGYNGCPS